MTNRRVGVGSVESLGSAECEAKGDHGKVTKLYREPRSEGESVGR